MSDIEKEFAILDGYLDACAKKDILVEAVWFAFDYKTKNPSWSLLKCFEMAIWDWMVYAAKMDRRPDLKEVIKKIEDINKKLGA